MRMRNLPEYPSARARQLRDSLSTASMRSATARRVRATRRALQWRRAMGSNDLPPYAPITPRRKPARIDVRHTRCYAGEPPPRRYPVHQLRYGVLVRGGRGLRDGRGGDCGVGGGVGSADGLARVGVGCGAAVVGTPGFGLVPGPGALEPDGLAAPPGALGEAEPEVDSPGFGFPCPCLPSPAEPPNPIPPPGAPNRRPAPLLRAARRSARAWHRRPRRRPRSCSRRQRRRRRRPLRPAGRVRRWGARGHLRGRKKGVPLSTPTAHRKTRAAPPSPVPDRELPLPDARRARPASHGATNGSSRRGSSPSGRTPAPYARTA